MSKLVKGENALPVITINDHPQLTESTLGALVEFLNGV